MTDAELSAGAVARRLGVAVTTLRTWHRRYQLGPTGHTAGLHRRYTEQDIARLETMRRLTARGVPAAEAARHALARPADRDRTDDHDPRGRRDADITPNAGSRDAGSRDADGGDSDRHDGAGGVGPARDGGGRTIAVGRAGAAAHGLARAASRLDSPMMLATVSAALAADGVVATWDAVLRPVLAGLGDQHADGGRLVAVEHLLSRCVSEALAGVPRPPADIPARVLLACAPEEQHSLPLEALAAALAEQAKPCRLLGARVPADALCDAVTRTGPEVVVVWSHMSGTADADLLLRLLAGAHPPAVVAAAGPGWSGMMPREIDRPADLASAVALAGAV